MASAASPTEFPIVHCTVCDADVLGWLDLDEQDREVTRCLECSTAADAARFRWLTYPRRKHLRAPKATVPPSARFSRQSRRGRAGIEVASVHAVHPLRMDGRRAPNRGAADTLNGRSVAGAFRGSLLRPSIRSGHTHAPCVCAAHPTTCGRHSRPRADAAARLAPRIAGRTSKGRPCGCA